jgi:formylglycine-generating enzyme required for sulfatase activity
MSAPPRAPTDPADARPPLPLWDGLQGYTRRLAGFLDQCVQHQQHDPEAFLWNARRSTEALCLILLSRHDGATVENGGPGGERGLDALLRQVETTGALSDRAVARLFETIERGSHPGVHVRGPAPDAVGLLIHAVDRSLADAVTWVYTEGPAADVLQRIPEWAAVQPLLDELRAGGRGGPPLALQVQGLEIERERLLAERDHLLTCNAALDARHLELQRWVSDLEQRRLELEAERAAQAERIDAEVAQRLAAERAVLTAGQEGSSRAVVAAAAGLSVGLVGCTLIVLALMSGRGAGEAVGPALSASEPVPEPAIAAVAADIPAPPPGAELALLGPPPPPGASAASPDVDAGPGALGLDAPAPGADPGARPEGSPAAAAGDDQAEPDQVEPDAVEPGPVDAGPPPVIAARSAPACPEGTVRVAARTVHIGQPDGGRTRWPPAFPWRIEPFEVPAFCVDRTPVSWANLGPGPAAESGCARAMSGRRPGAPSACVTRDEAERSCRRRGGRLPTIAEWESLARAALDDPAAALTGGVAREWVADRFPPAVFHRAAAPDMPPGDGMFRQALDEPVPPDGNVLWSWNQQPEGARIADLGFRCAWDAP